jgi:hypothetical protein
MIETTFLPMISLHTELRVGPNARPVAKSASGRTAVIESPLVRLSTVVVAGGIIDEARAQVKAIVAAAIVWNHFFAFAQLCGFQLAIFQLRSTDRDRFSRHLVGREKFLLGVLFTLGSSETTETCLRCLESEPEGNSVLQLDSWLAYEHRLSDLFRHASGSFSAGMGGSGGGDHAGLSFSIRGDCPTVDSMLGLH